MRSMVALTCAGLLSVFAAVVGANTDDVTVFNDPSAAYGSRIQSGDVSAMYSLGLIYAVGAGVPSDQARAIDWLQKAATNGHIVSQRIMASKYAHGFGVPKDLKVSFSWYMKAAQQGDPIAEEMVGLSYSLGRGVKEDDALATMWLRKAAEQGLASAQYLLSRRYARFTDESLVPVDQDEAIRWLKKSADQGYYLAQEDLAYRHERRGQGVPLDHAAAAQLYLKSAAQNIPGNATPHLPLGMMYVSGRGLHQSDVLAFEHFVKYMDIAGYASGTEALEQLAFMYAYGDGLKQNDLFAYLLMRLAVARGSTKTEVLQRYRRRLSPDQLVYAERIASDGLRDLQ